MISIILFFFKQSIGYNVKAIDENNKATRDLRSADGFIENNKELFHHPQFFNDILFPTHFVNTPKYGTNVNTNCPV